MRVLVTGASGQLADAVLRAFADRDLVSYTRATLDVTDVDAVRLAVDQTAPDLIINCAAFNRVDEAESHPADAFAVNAFAVRTLVRAAEGRGAALVHYGSDFVFAGLDGPDAEPYDESVEPSPRSIYAASKLVGDWLALAYPRAYVLRVESLFGLPAAWNGRRGSLDTIVAGLEAGRDVPVFTDRVVSPSYVVDVAAATRYLIDAHAPAGLYHCVNSGRGTWYQVAGEVARLLGVLADGLRRLGDGRRPSRGQLGEVSLDGLAPLAGRPHHADPLGPGTHARSQHSDDLTRPQPDLCQVPS